MAKIPEHYNIGNQENLTTERLLEIIQDLYNQLAIAINKKPDLYERSTDGLASDVFLSNGSININTGTEKVEMLTKHNSTSLVTWKTLT